ESTDAPPGDLALPATLHSKLSSWGEAWVEHADEPELAALDFGWMKQLSKFGYWNLYTDSPLARLSRPRFLAMPAPSFLDLIGWAKLRLLRAARDGDWAQASAEVRQLAWLAFSTEVSSGGWIGFAILKTERTAWEA